MNIKKVENISAIVLLVAFVLPWIRPWLYVSHHEWIESC